MSFESAGKFFRKSKWSALRQALQPLSHHRHCLLWMTMMMHPTRSLRMLARMMVMHDQKSLSYEWRLQVQVHLLPAALAHVCQGCHTIPVPRHHQTCGCWGSRQ